MRKLLALVFLLCLVSCVSESQPTIATNSAPGEDVQEHCIVHAGGILWGRDNDVNYTSFAGSNSLEGLVQCADNGYSAVEMDFCFTEDGYLACIHNWSADFIESVTDNSPLTLEEFLNSKIYGIFTPVSLDEVTAFLREHENMIIVTDIKENFNEAVRLIAETGLTDRFAVQIYHEEQYELVRNYGFGKIIYTLYEQTWDEKTDTDAIASFVESHNLAAIAFDKDLCMEPDYVEKMKQIGTPLLVHTVNENIEHYFEMGISGVYTDVLK